MMKDVLPTLIKLSAFFQKESVGLASVPPMVLSTITTLQTLRNDLKAHVHPIGIARVYYCLQALLLFSCAI